MNWLGNSQVVLERSSKIYYTFFDILYWFSRLFNVFDEFVKHYSAFFNVVTFSLCMNENNNVALLLKTRSGYFMFSNEEVFSKSISGSQNLSREHSTHYLRALKGYAWKITRMIHKQVTNIESERAVIINIPNGFLIQQWLRLNDEDTQEMKTNEFLDTGSEKSIYILSWRDAFPSNTNTITSMSISYSKAREKTQIQSCSSFSDPGRTPMNKSTLPRLFINILILMLFQLTIPATQNHKF